MTLQAIRNEATLHAPVPLASLTGEDAYRILSAVHPADLSTIQGLLRNGYSPVDVRNLLTDGEAINFVGALWERAATYWPHRMSANERPTYQRPRNHRHAWPGYIRHEPFRRSLDRPALWRNQRTASGNRH